MRSLRTRLILSHILPLLVVVPLVGIALIYFLETQVLLPNLSAELTHQAILTADIAQDHPDIWQNPASARAFVARYSVHHQSQVMLLDPTGKLLASSNPADTERPGQTIELAQQVLAGENSVRLNDSPNLQTEIAEVLVPVVGAGQHVIGVVRLTHQLPTIFEQFARPRYLIAGILTVGLLLGAGVGLVLALDLEGSLRRVSNAMLDVAYGQQLTTLPERGPEEIRQLLRAFNTLAERLRMLEEARRRLLANLVHEVGRPVGALQSAIQALLNGADRDETFRCELLTGMATEVQRMQPLLHNLTELHGYVLGTLELNCRPTALSNWLPPTLAPWREAVQAKGLHWQAAIPPELPVLTVDPDRLAQVLGNLLSNALKYTPVNGAVSVEAGLENEAVWIRVSDTGPGLSKEEQGHIFEPFYRSQRGRRFPQGLGLGLTLAQDLIAAHRGRLDVKSQPGQGSCFAIWLPQDSLQV
jgi:two-component system sensor histidine kinase BaeS